MDLKHYHWLLVDSFVTCNKVQMWKIGSPRMSGRCFPSADTQKLRLTLFSTEGTRTWWGKHIHSWQKFNVNILDTYTHDTSLVLSLALIHSLFFCQLLTWFSLHGTSRNGNTMNNMKNMPNVWRRTGIWLLSPARLINHCVFVSTHSPPTLKEIAELRRVKLGNDSGFTADQSMAAYIALSHDISCTTRCCCPTVCSPKSPSPSTSKPTPKEQKLE